MICHIDAWQSNINKYGESLVNFILFCLDSNQTIKQNLIYVDK